MRRHLAQESHGPVGGWQLEGLAEARIPLDLDEMQSCAASYLHGLRMPSNMMYGGRYESAA